LIIAWSLKWGNGLGVHMAIKTACVEIASLHPHSIASAEYVVGHVCYAIEAIVRQIKRAAEGGVKRACATLYQDEFCVIKGGAPG